MVQLQRCVEIRNRVRAAKENSTTKTLMPRNSLRDTQDCVEPLFKEGSAVYEVNRRFSEAQERIRLMREKLEGVLASSITRDL